MCAGISPSATVIVSFSPAVKKNCLQQYLCVLALVELLSNVPSSGLCIICNLLNYLCVLVGWVDGVSTLHLILTLCEEKTELTTSES